MDVLSRFWDRGRSFGFGRAQFVGPFALLGVLVLRSGSGFLCVPLFFCPPFLGGGARE